MTWTGEEAPTNSCDVGGCKFGSVRQHLPPLLKRATNVLVVVSAGGQQRGYVDLVRGAVGKGVQVEVLADAPVEPSIADGVTRDVMPNAIEESAIVAIGGGSVLDYAKLVRSQWMYGQEAVRRHLLGQRELPKDLAPIPIFSIPTTAGTGSEVTSFATIWDPAAAKKYSLDLPSNRPRTCVLDANLLTSLEGDSLVYPLLDAVSHAMESLWNVNRTVDSADFAICALQGLDRVLAELSREGRVLDLQLLQRASHNSGHAIAITRTALAHAISYPLTLNFGVPHGLAASFSLPIIAGWPQVRETLDLCGLALVDSVASRLVNMNLRLRLERYGESADMGQVVLQQQLNGRAGNTSFNYTSEDIQKIFDI